MQAQNLKPAGVCGGAALLFAVLGMLLVNLNLTEAEPESKHTAEPTQSDNSGTDAPKSPAQAEKLADQYVFCAQAAGFDPGGAQVITNEAGEPQRVKTGTEVPARVHRLCFIEIGGADPKGTSYDPSSAASSDEELKIRYVPAFKLPDSTPGDAQVITNETGELPTRTGSRDSLLKLQPVPVSTMR